MRVTYNEKCTTILIYHFKHVKKEGKNCKNKKEFFTQITISKIEGYYIVKEMRVV